MMGMNESIRPWNRTQNLFLNYLGGNGNDARCRFDMQDMAECSFDWGCKCQDSRNNTYTCLRSLTQTEDSLFCQVKIDTSTQSYGTTNI